MIFPDPKNLVRKLSVKNRITLMVILISVFPILVISIFSYAKAYISIQSTAKVYSFQILRSVSQRIDTVMQEETLLDAEAGEWAMPHSLAELRKYFRPELRRYIVGAALQQGNTVWERTGADVRWDAGWQLTQDDGGTLVARAVSLPDGSRAMVYFAPELLSHTMQEFQQNTYNKLILADPAGHLLNGSADALSILEGTAITNSLSAAVGTKPIHLERENGIFTCGVELPIGGWRLFLTVPYNQMMQPLQSIFFVTLIGTILMLNFAMLVIDSIDRPMRALVSSFSAAAHMNFEVSLEDENIDELGVLSSAFNEICQQMRDSLRQIEREQNDKRKAEIKMLQAQINPHFLFNTLDSLRFTSMMSNVPTVSSGLGALSHLLRSSILKDNSTVALESELQNVEDYLTLQRIRSCETINLIKEIAPEVHNANMMKLLLQPIVENSVIHGMRENIPLDIRITARKEGEMLLVDILDNGKGFDASKAEGSAAGIPKSEKMSGIGLANVRDRLQLTYKEKQSFTIESRPNIGTVVHIAMPFSIWEEAKDV